MGPLCRTQRRFSSHLVLCPESLASRAVRMSSLVSASGICKYRLALGGRSDRLGFWDTKAEAAFSLSDCASSPGNLSQGLPARKGPLSCCWKSPLQMHLPSVPDEQLRDWMCLTFSWGTHTLSALQLFNHLWQQRSLISQAESENESSAFCEGYISCILLGHSSCVCG